MPVDASEASKHPEKHDYYFGHFDESRVAFTIGRDLVLTPPQKGEPLNYLIYPYAELDGASLPQKEIKTKFLTQMRARDAVLEERELRVFVDVEICTAA